MKRILAALAVFALAAFATSCKSQLPPSPLPTVLITWTAPAACTTAAPCVYAISRSPAVSGACSGTAGTFYTLVGTSASQATTYTDTTAAGGSFCWIAQTQQGTPVLTSVASGVSNAGVPLAVPSVPAAPGAPNASTVAQLTAPALFPETHPVVASIEGPPAGLNLIARLK